MWRWTSADAVGWNGSTAHGGPVTHQTGTSNPNRPTQIRRCQCVRVNFRRLHSNSGDLAIVGGELSSVAGVGGRSGPPQTKPNSPNRTTRSCELDGGATEVRRSCWSGVPRRRHERRFECSVLRHFSVLNSEWMAREGGGAHRESSGAERSVRGGSEARVDGGGDGWRERRARVRQNLI